MIVETSGGWVATHWNPLELATETKRFSTFLAAKTWMLVMDDRHGTRGYARSALICSAEHFPNGFHFAYLP